AAQQFGRGVQVSLLEDLANAAVGILDRARVYPDRLFQLRPDPQRGIERRGRILGHVSDPRASDGPQPGGGQAQQVDAVDPDLEPADVQPGLVPWRPESRTGANLLVAGHHACSGPRSSRRAASSGRRSTLIVTRATASVNVLVPTVSRAISTAGAITAQGLSC